MRNNLVQYVNLLFAGTPGNDEIRQEILQNTLDRYDDLVAQGKAPEAAYQLAISGIGDINEIFTTCRETSTPPRATAEPLPETPKEAQRRKLATGLAIALFILCPVPLFLVTGTAGLCLLLAMVAIGVALLVIFDKDDDKDEDEQEEEQERFKEATPRQKLRNAISSVSGIFVVALYLFISISTRAWGITWVIFPIWGCLSGLVNAIIDYKEAKKYE